MRTLTAHPVKAALGIEMFTRNVEKADVSLEKTARSINKFNRNVETTTRNMGMTALTVEITTNIIGNTARNAKKATRSVVKAINSLGMAARSGNKAANNIEPKKNKETNKMENTAMLKAKMILTIAGMLMASTCVAYAQSDSTLIGKKAHIRLSYTSVENLYANKANYLNFVTKTGKVFKRIKIQAPSSTKYGDKHDTPENTMPTEVYTGEVKAFVCGNKTRAVVEEYKMIPQPDAYYGKTGRYGINKNTITLYDANGNVLFQKKDAPYSIRAISENGEKMCCEIPLADMLIRGEIGGDLYENRKGQVKDSLLGSGRIFVLDDKGNLIYQHHHWSDNLWIYLSPNGNWLYYGEGVGGWLVNLESNNIIRLLSSLDKTIIDKIKPIGFTSAIYAISDNGCLLFEAYFENIRPFKYRWIIYNPRNETIEIGDIRRIVE